MNNYTVKTGNSAIGTASRIEQQEKSMQDQYNRNRTPGPVEQTRPMLEERASIPQATRPISIAIKLLEERAPILQATAERLIVSLQPVTTKSDDTYPDVQAAAREGNSNMTIDLNLIATRIDSITNTLQIQIDRLEV